MIIDDGIGQLRQMILKHMVMIDTMTLKCARQNPTSASAGSGVAGCDLAPYREMPEQTHSGLARTDAKNSGLLNATAQGEK